MNIYPVGTVVKLNGGEHKLMITSRTPLTNQDGVVGYYDYGACLYPEGQTNQNTFFFNTEDINEIFFEGYCDEMEEEFQKKYEENIGSIQYPKLKIK